MKPAETAVLILAAGASRRMGKPKQQLRFHNQTLLARITATALELKAGPVFVVVNEDLPVEQKANTILITNKRSQEGIASSIQCGIKYIQTQCPEIETVIITVCDQPYISVDILQEMIHCHHSTQLPIIACAYAATIGTPVLFHQSMFPELLALKGDQGARHLLKKDLDKVGIVNFPLGNIDIDTEEDYERLIKE